MKLMVFLSVIWLIAFLTFLGHEKTETLRFVIQPLFSLLYTYSRTVFENQSKSLIQHTNRIIGFTLGATSSDILYIFGIGMTSRFQNCPR